MVAAAQVIKELKEMGSEEDRAGLAKVGIEVDHALGIKVTELRKIAKSLGQDHKLATDLWASGIHEARILASIVEEPTKVSATQMDRWAKAFDSWDLCDQVCLNLFDRTPFGWTKAVEWTERDREFEKRAGFALMAVLAVHDKESPDARFLPFFPLMEREAGDDRVYVKKAVNWALRQTGKRSAGLKRKAIACANRIAEQDTKSAKWIARDALKELQKR